MFLVTLLSIADTLKANSDMVFSNATINIKDVVLLKKCFIVFPSINNICIYFIFAYLIGIKSFYNNFKYIITLIKKHYNKNREKL